MTLTPTIVHKTKKTNKLYYTGNDPRNTSLFSRVTSAHHKPGAFTEILVIQIFLRPKTGCVRAEIGFTGQLHRPLTAKLFQAPSKVTIFHRSNRAGVIFHVVSCSPRSTTRVLYLRNVFSYPLELLEQYITQRQELERLSRDLQELDSEAENLLAQFSVAADQYGQCAGAA